MYKYTRIVVNFDTDKKVDNYTHTSQNLNKIVGHMMDNYTTTFQTMPYMRGFEKTESYVNHNWHNELKWVGYTIMFCQHYWKDDIFYVVYWGLEEFDDEC